MKISWLALAAALISVEAAAQQIGPTSGGTPGGSSGQVQYNSSGAFSGSAGSLVYTPALSQPAAPTVTQAGTPGGTSITYSIVAANAFGHSVPGLPTTTTTSVGTGSLNGTNYNIVTTPAVTGATSCQVLRNSSFSTQPGFFTTYVGTVACGGVVNDKGSTLTPYPDTLYPALGGGVGYPGSGTTMPDGSSGLLINNNLTLNGHMTVGNGLWNVLSTPNEKTSSDVILNVAGNFTGNGVANGDPDPVLIQGTMILAPAGNNYINQPWAAQVTLVVPSSNAFSMSALEGGVFTVALDGVAGSTMNQGEGLLGNMIIRGAAKAIGTYASAVSAEAAYSSSASQATPLDGLYVTTQHSGAGTLTAMNAVDVYPDYFGSGPVITLTGVNVELSNGSNIQNFTGLLLNDNHLIGSVTSYAIHTIGASAKNLFDGAVAHLGTLSQGNNVLLASTATGASLDIPNPALVTSATISSAGSGAVPGTEVFGPQTPAGVYLLSATGVTAASIVTAGTSFNASTTCTVHTTTQTGTQSTINVTTNGSGVITSINSITTAGSFTANPTNIAAEPIAGCGGGQGATFSLTIGAVTVTPVRGDAYSSCPGSVAVAGGGTSGIVLTPGCTTEKTLGLNISGGPVTLPGIISVGTKFTTSGCSVSSTTGGATAGKFTVGANNCTVVITMAGATGLSATNGWACHVNDETATTLFIGQSASNATTASISVPVTAGATDVFSFACTGY